MAHKVFFVFSVIALIGFTVDIFVPQHEYVFLFSACASAPGLIAAKWSIYTPEIVNAPPKVTLVWRWGNEIASCNNRMSGFLGRFIVV